MTSRIHNLTSRFNNLTSNLHMTTSNKHIVTLGNLTNVGVVRQPHIVHWHALPSFPEGPIISHGGVECPCPYLMPYRECQSRCVKGVGKNLKRPNKLSSPSSVSHKPGSAETVTQNSPASPSPSASAEATKTEMLTQTRKHFNSSNIVDQQVMKMLHPLVG